MTTERKKGSKGMARTELVAVRFDPRTKYLLDIAARVQRRSIANYIEWAVEDSFKRLDMGRGDGQEETVESAGRILWHVDEIERLMMLSRTHPNLLTFEEQRLVKLAHLATVWGKVGAAHAEAQANYLRPHWDMLQQAAAEGLSFEEVLEKIDPPRTAERFDARIAQLAGDIEQLKEMKKSLLSTAKPAASKKAKAK